MAQLFPATLPEEILKDSFRSSEVQVYNALQQLDDSYHIYYSSPWLGTMPDGSEIDGEADFLVAHSEYGLLSIEVKGGRVDIDNNDQWTSTDRHNFKRTVKNPVRQSLSSKHQILEHLNKSSHWTRRYINANHGVILPHSVRPSRDFRPDMPLKIFAFDEDMKFLDKWVQSRMQDTMGDRCEGLGEDGLYAIKDMFTRQISLRVRLGTHLKEDMKEISLKTNEQILLIREMADNRRMGITGAAGTGKTILAMEKAIMMAEENKRVLLLCFNRPLGKYIKEELADYPTITATHFHQYCSDLAAAAKPASDVTDLQSLTEDLVENFVDSGQVEFDAVIIDEGQDFRDTWLESLEVVVRSGETGVIYIFHDDNQNVMATGSQYISRLAAARYRLTRNFRNTKEIFRKTEQYYSSTTPVRPVGPEGINTIFHEAANPDAVKRLLAERAGHLIKSEGIQPGEITILFANSSAVDLVRDKRGYRVGQYRAGNAENRNLEQLCVDTIRRFKGLESPVVILVVDGEAVRSSELMYTGITRAQVALEVVGPRHALNSIQECP